MRGAFWALGLTAGSWGSRIPDVKDDLGLSEGALGSALLGLSIGAVIGAWFGGLLVHRLGGRRVIAGSWALVGLLLLTPGLAGSWAALAGAALVVGLAIGVLDVSMNGAGVQLEQQAAEPLLNGLHARWSAGVLVGAGVGAALVAVGVDVAVHLGAVGLLLVAGAVANRRRLPDGRLAAPGLADAPEPFDDLGDLVGDRAAGRPATSGAGRSGRLAALGAIGGFVFLGDGALMDWAGVLVRDDLDGGAVLGALAVTGLSAGGLAGRLAGDRLAVRWGPAPVVRRGATLAAVAWPRSCSPRRRRSCRCSSWGWGPGSHRPCPWPSRPRAAGGASTASPWSPPPATAATSPRRPWWADWPTPPTCTPPSWSPWSWWWA